MATWKSLEEYEDGKDYGSLPEEEYRFKVTGVTELPPVVSLYDEKGVKPRLRVFVAPIALAEDPDAPLVNTEGEDLDPEKSVLMFFDPTSVGFKQDGTPSKFRKFVATLLGVNPKGNISFDTYEDFIGKEFYGAIEHNGKYDRMGDIRPVRRATRPAPAPKPEPAQTVTKDDLTKQAKEVFGDDADDLPF